METCKSWELVKGGVDHTNSQWPTGSVGIFESVNEQIFSSLRCRRGGLSARAITCQLSESLVQGFNGGALDFVLAGHLHSMGGYGLWRRHFDLIRFTVAHKRGSWWQRAARFPSETLTILGLFMRGESDCFCRQHCGGRWVEASNCILYELDVVSGHWTRLGVVDARIGMFQEVHALEHGALVLNRAGEMVWLDFNTHRRSCW